MDHNLKDRHGNTAPVDLIGRKFKHAKRGQVYEVIGFAWIGDTDDWGVLHSRMGVPVLVRSFLNFTGDIEPGTPRFEEVTE